MNLQAHLMVKSKENGNWQCYCREPVTSESQAIGLAQMLATRLKEPVQISLQDWDSNWQATKELGPYNPR